MLFSSDKAELDIWSSIEIDELKKIQEMLYDKILEINENLFVYKEFRLPKKTLIMAFVIIFNIIIFLTFYT